MLLFDRSRSQPGKRPLVWAAYQPQPQFKHPRLFCGFPRVTGRGLTGVRTVRTKGAASRLRSKFGPSLLLSRGLFTLSLVVLWQTRPLRKGALLVLRSALGSWFTAPASVTAQPMTYIQALPPAQRANAYETELHPQRHWWRQLVAIHPYAHVSYVAIFRGGVAVFARALGAVCRVLIPQLARGWALLSLPSGRLRFISNDSFVILGSIAPEALRTFAVPSAGYNHRSGVAPIVRGTARNPNDHPHGGRTRAIRYPRTPWGLTAKHSRQPRLLPRLKALAKRRPHQTRTYVPYWEA